MLAQKGTRSTHVDTAVGLGVKMSVFTYRLRYLCVHVWSITFLRRA